MLAPVPLSQAGILAQQLVRTLAFQELYGARYRYVRRDRDQHVHVLSVDRSSVDCQFEASRYLPQQLSRPVPDIAHQHRVTVLRDPDEVVLAIPDCMAPGFVVFHSHHSTSVADWSVAWKARGLRIPEGGL